MNGIYLQELMGEADFIGCVKFALQEVQFIKMFAEAFLSFSFNFSVCLSQTDEWASVKK